MQILGAMRRRVHKSLRNILSGVATMIRRPRTLVCTVALAWLLPGCGQGGDAPSDSAARPEFRPRPGEASKKEFIMELLRKKGKLPAAPPDRKK
jgi:hypothetical protein